MPNVTNSSSGRLRLKNFHLHMFLLCYVRVGLVREAQLGMQTGFKDLGWVRFGVGVSNQRRTKARARCLNASTPH